jgi:hypothetical protein
MLTFYGRVFKQTRAVVAHISISADAWQSEMQTFIIAAQEYIGVRSLKLLASPMPYIQPLGAIVLNVKLFTT